MPKVIFLFGGTGDNGAEYCYQKEKHSKFADDVIRIYIKGCQESQVGGFSLGLLPDLSVAAKNIRRAFSGDQLDLKKLEDNFGSGLYEIHGNEKLGTNIKVDDIVLEGFSRGAITTFAVAKELDELEIPLHIIANQPVPGTLSLFDKYHDLTACKNIQSAVTILATHNLENGLIENQLFNQMVAKFNSNTQESYFHVPHQQHLEWQKDSPVPLHIAHLFRELGYAKGELTKQNIFDWYQNKKHYFFTPPEFMQTIHGQLNEIPQDPLFLEFLINKAQNLFTGQSEQLTSLLENEREQFLTLVAIENKWFNTLSPADKETFITLSAGKKELMLSFLKDDVDSSFSDEEKKPILNSFFKHLIKEKEPTFDKPFSALDNAAIKDLSSPEQMVFFATIQSERKLFFTSSPDNILSIDAHEEKNKFLALPQKDREMLSSDINKNGRLSAEQAAALLSLNLLEMDGENKVDLCKLALEDSNRGVKFVAIVNKIAAICDYLSKAPQVNTIEKTSLIEEHSALYKKALFTSSYQYLILDKPADNDAKKFDGAIYQAEKVFRSQAIGLDRSFINQVLRVVTNVITHITGVGLIVNAINKYKTGNWLLFQRTESETVVKKMRQELSDLKQESSLSSELPVQNSMLDSNKKVQNLKEDEEPISERSNTPGRI